MCKRLLGLMCIAVLALSMVACGAKEESKAEVPEVETAVVEEPEEPAEAIEFIEVYNWYVGDVWNVLNDFSDYVERGTDCMGQEFDAEYAYTKYLKTMESKDKYTNYIHENHPDIATAWDKMMEQVDAINENLADGFEVGSEAINLELLQQYSEDFYEYQRTL